MSDHHQHRDPPKDAAAPAARAISLETLIYSRASDDLRAAASDSRLTEDLALTLLERRDLPERALDDLAHNGTAMKSRRVINALVRHPKAPRHVSLPIARRLFTFELMQLALTPGLAVDLKMAVEEVLISRLESITSGERLNLARRASTRVAAALLRDSERRIVEAALDNPYLTEEHVVKTLVAGAPSLLKQPSAKPAHDVAPELAAAVCRHSKWSVRREVRVALLRCERTPLAAVLEIAESLPTGVLRHVLKQSLLPANVKHYLEQLAGREEKHRAQASSD